MKITYLKTNSLRKSTQFNFHNSVVNLINEIGAENLKVEGLFEEYSQAVETQGVSMRWIKKSNLTEQSQECDVAREATYSAIRAICKASTHSDKPKLRAAAKRINLVLDTYGYINREPDIAQTALLYKFSKEINTNFAAEANTLGITQWIKQLEKYNNEFRNLAKKRIDEAYTKPKVSVKDARIASDKAYQAIRNRIHAFINFEETEASKKFITKLNLIIKQHKALLPTSSKSSAKS